MIVIELCLNLFSLKIFVTYRCKIFEWIMEYLVHVDVEYTMS